MVKTAGYVVEARNGRFLSRKMRFVRKRNRKRPGQEKGIERAWVHTVENLKVGGAWVRDAYKIYPAEYDPGPQTTQITGKVIYFEQFALWASGTSLEDLD